MNTLPIVLTGLFLCTSLGACSSSVATPDGTGGAGGHENPADTSFKAVQAIFDAHCVNCHDAQLPGGIPYDPSLSLVAADAYTSLVNKPAAAACGGQLVVPGAPDKSFLMQKLNPGAPCYGSHMPRPFEVGPELNLSATELATVRGWISDGAMP